MSTAVAECGKRYGNNRRRICRLPAGHKGWHSMRRNLAQIIEEHRRG